MTDWPGDVTPLPHQPPADRLAGRFTCDHPEHQPAEEQS